MSRTSQGRARDTGETGQIGRPSQIGVNVRVHFVTGSEGRWWKHLKQQFNSAGLAKGAPRICWQLAGCFFRRLPPPACVAQEDRRLRYQNEQFIQGGKPPGKADIESKFLDR